MNNIDFFVVCSCGNKLEASVVVIAGTTELIVDPCKDCLMDAESEGYAEGLSK